MPCVCCLHYWHLIENCSNHGDQWTFSHWIFLKCNQCLFAPCSLRGKLWLTCGSDFPKWNGWVNTPKKIQFSTYWIPSIGWCILNKKVFITKFHLLFLFSLGREREEPWAILVKSHFCRATSRRNQKLEVRVKNLE